MKTLILTTIFLSLLSCKKESPAPVGVCKDVSRIESLMSLSDSQLFKAGRGEWGKPETGICIIEDSTKFNYKYELQAGGMHLTYADNEVGAAVNMRDALKECKCGL